MKKILVLVLVVVMVFAVCSLTACGIETYTGEYKSETINGTYGVKVDVKVKDGVIKSVKLWSDEDTGWMRTTPAEYWDGTSLGIGYEAAEAAYPEFLEKFEGKTVEEIMEIPALLGVVLDKDWHIAGATASASRIVLAVQNALSKISAEA